MFSLGWRQEPVMMQRLAFQHAHFTGAADSSAARCGHLYATFGDGIQHRSASRDTYVDAAASENKRVRSGLWVNRQWRRNEPLDVHQRFRPIAGGIIKASSIPIGPQQLALVPGAGGPMIVLMSGRLVVLS
jgi:hypothetical protein